MISNPPDREDCRLARGRATRAHVLDAAERLFAQKGFDGVSIRDIAAEAGVTLGVVAFHGGGKEELFRTLLARRVEALSSARLERLARLAGQHEPPSLRQIVAGFVEPYVEIASAGDEQWSAYSRLISNIGGDERWFPYIHELFDPVAVQFLDAIRVVRPKADERKLAAAFVMTIASMVRVVASQARIDRLCRPPRQSRSPAEFRDAIIDFCTAGIEDATKQLERGAQSAGLAVRQAKSSSRRRSLAT